MYDENCLAISPSKYQDIGCSSLSFNYTCKIHDGTELESRFEALKSAPLKSIDARIQQGDATGMYEKEIESADLLYVADSERTHLGDEPVLMQF